MNTYYNDLKQAYILNKLYSNNKTNLLTAKYSKICFKLNFHGEFINFI